MNRVVNVDNDVFFIEKNTTENKKIFISKNENGEISIQLIDAEKEYWVDASRIEGLPRHGSVSKGFFEQCVARVSYGISGLQCVPRVQFHIPLRGGMIEGIVALGGIIMKVTDAARTASEKNSDNIKQRDVFVYNWIENVKRKLNKYHESHGIRYYAVCYRMSEEIEGEFHEVQFGRRDIIGGEEYQMYVFKTGFLLNRGKDELVNWAYIGGEEQMCYEDPVGVGQFVSWLCGKSYKKEIPKVVW